MKNRVFIIAEAGVNHNGDLDIAKRLIDAAAAAGVDAIKFQTFRASDLVASSAPKAQYQLASTSADESQLEMIRKLELTAADHNVLIEHCARRSVEFVSSPFDLDSIDLLDRLGVRVLKVPSGEVTNLPYLKKIGRVGKDIILSTGMCRLDEISSALDVLLESGMKRENVLVLHCNTEYPTPMEDVNLRAMLTIRDELNVSVGYSDHTEGIEVSLAAAAMGASIIEKHFTLDRTMKGPDHKASIEPDELKAMVTAIRNIEKALGDGVKRPSRSEAKNMTIARKSIVAACKIKTGERFTEVNLAVKRPGNGINPMKYYELIGTVSPRDFAEDELIQI